LRSSDADRARGASLLKARCATCAPPTPPAMADFAWQAERSDSQIVAAIAAPDMSDPRPSARQALRLVDDALTAARDHRAADAGDLAFDAYIAFEPLEASARMRNPGLVADMERHFADFKSAMKAGDIGAAEAERGRIERGMPSILELS